MSLASAKMGLTGAQVLRELARHVKGARLSDEQQRIGTPLERECLQSRKMADVADEIAELERLEQLPLRPVEAAGEHELQTLASRR